MAGAIALAWLCAFQALPASAAGVSRTPLPPPQPDGVAASEPSIAPLPPPAAPRQDRRWVALSGSTFKETLAGWASSTGWSVVWDLPVDYTIRASASFGGDFEQAVLSLSDAIYDHNPSFLVTLYRGNRVVHVREASPATAK